MPTLAEIGLQEDAKLRSSHYASMSKRSARERAAAAAEGLSVAEYQARSNYLAQVGQDIAHLPDTGNRPTAAKQRGKAASPAPSAKVPAANRVAGTARFTQADIDAAFARGVAQERQKVAAVFASPHSKGRERACAIGLTSGMSAAGIIEVLEENALGARAESNAAWDRVNADRLASDPHLRSGNVTTPAQSSAKSQARWDKANDRVAAANPQVRNAPVAEQNPSVTKTPADRWEKANAKVEQQRSIDDVWANAYGSTAR